MSTHARSAIPRFDVLGVEVSAASMDTALTQLTEWIQAGQPAYVCASDANGVVSASSDAELRRVYNDSSMLLPDGMPLVWAGKLAGFSKITRVSGPDLMPAMLELAARQGWSSYFYGGAPGVAEVLARKFQSALPGLRVAGVYSPPFRELSEAELAHDAAVINGSGAAIVWVGLGAPKQERWMAENVHRFDRAVLIGVGAAFDMHSGRVRRAPLWAQRHGLEWIFRLMQEPRRLSRRYGRVVPAFLWGVLRRRPRPVPRAASTS
jgi:N-acetylglucosaminyldiphosphoundecaprenol N-acetyl-beta-D-mannosaminyltransferase